MNNQKRKHGRHIYTSGANEYCPGAPALEGDAKLLVSVVWIVPGGGVPGYVVGSSGFYQSQSVNQPRIDVWRTHIELGLRGVKRLWRIRLRHHNRRMDWGLAARRVIAKLRRRGRAHAAAVQEERNAAGDETQQYDAW